MLRVELDLLCSSIEEVEVSELESNPLSHFTNKLVAALDILGVGPWKMIVFLKTQQIFITAQTFNYKAH